MAFTKLEPGSVNVNATFTFNTVKTDNLQFANGAAWTGGSGGTASTAGSNTQIQFNDDGSLGASANLTFDKISNTLTVTNLVANGVGLTNLAGANVSGQVANSLVAGTVYTNAQPNITSIGTLTGLTSSGTVNLSSASNISLGTLSNVHISGGASGQAIITDGDGILSWSTITGGGTAQATYTKTYYWRGQLKENVGALRYYLPLTANITTINAYLTAAGTTQSTITIKKNGTAINTITFAAGATSNSQAGLDYAMTATDYITVDITKSSSATDLYVNFIYQG